MYNFTTYPNQKIVTIKKEKTDKYNYFAAINLNALELAARDLKSGAFKLWIYFAKNQHNFTFGLSNKAALECFGIKKDQYDKAVKELIEKGYLIQTQGNNFEFNELASGKKPQSQVVKNHISKQEKTLTNNTDNTNNNNTFIF